jgi:hypothetical protein
MGITLRLILRGLLTGTLVAGGLAVWDGVAYHGYMFGLQAALVGVPAGGLTLLLAFGMALLSYWLAKGNRLPDLRRHLLAGAIFAGAAGMACGFTSAALWAAAGRPWFP